MANVMYQYRDIDSKLMTNLEFSELQADGYASGFEKLAAWVDESLEAFRPEMSQVRRLVLAILLSPCCRQGRCQGLYTAHLAATTRHQ